MFMKTSACTYIHVCGGQIFVSKGAMHHCTCAYVWESEHMPCIWCVPMTSTGDRKRHPGSKIGIMTVSMHMRGKEQDVYKAWQTAAGNNIQTRVVKRNLAHPTPTHNTYACIYWWHLICKHHRWHTCYLAQSPHKHQYTEEQYLYSLHRCFRQCGNLLDMHTGSSLLLLHILHFQYSCEDLLYIQEYLVWV